MGLSRRQFTKEFKLAAVRRLEQGVSIARGGAGVGGEPERAAPLAAGVPPGAGQRVSRQRQAALVRRPGRRAGAEDRPAGAGDRFFEGVLAAHRGTADAAGIDWKSAVYRKVQEEVKADRGLTIERMVELGRVSRAGFYRFDQDAAAAAGYGHGSARCDPADRVGVAELRAAAHHRGTAPARLDGESANGSIGIMREDNLLCVRRRKFVVTTDSNHGRRVYPNLAGKMELTGVDQLWVADITYIRLREEFVYLAVILDAYSRRVIGWALDRTLEDDLTLAALRMALPAAAVRPGLVHHSDRGVAVRLATTTPIC